MSPAHEAAYPRQKAAAQAKELGCLIWPQGPCASPQRHTASSGKPEALLKAAAGGATLHSLPSLIMPGANSVLYGVPMQESQIACQSEGTHHSGMQASLQAQDVRRLELARQHLNQILADASTRAYKHRHHMIRRWVNAGTKGCLPLILRPLIASNPTAARQSVSSERLRLYSQEF